MRKYDVGRKRSGKDIPAIQTYLKYPERIIGIDGEGVTRDGVHHYVLLAVRDGEGTYGVVRNGEGLTTKQCLDFLCSLPENSVKVAFSFGYDVNMILKDLKWDQLERLHKGQYITWTNYRLRYIPRKLFYVGMVNKPSMKCTVYDTFTFYQTSFVKALRAWNVGEEYESLINDIETMKEQRGNFHGSMLRQIEKYCLDECLLLVRMTQRLFVSLDKGKIYPSQYTGPGALAGYVLKQHHVKDYMDSEGFVEKIQVIGNDETKGIELLGSYAQLAYYGGRFDVSKVGHFEKVWYYDINSAYPYTCSLLPCLKHGRWIRAKGYDPRYRHAIWRVKWVLDINTQWPPFPWRNSKGEIFYTHYGRGWYWAHEVQMAHKLLDGQKCIFEVIDGYIWLSECEHKPFGWIPEYYNLRRQYQKENNPAERVMKLAMNSFYGKLAQTVGFTEDKAPPFHNLTWAGMITSDTRAMLLDVMSYDPEAVIMVATDGLISTRELPLPEGYLSDELGRWKMETPGQLWLFQPGIYWFPDKQGIGDVKTRGHNPLEINWSDLLNAWRKDPFDGVYNYQTTRFVGMGLALQQADYAGNWRSWLPMDNTIHFTPRRREIKTSKKEAKRTGVLEWIPRWDMGAGNSWPYRGNGFEVREMMKEIEREQP